jgi:hypothetical protein
MSAYSPQRAQIEIALDLLAKDGCFNCENSAFGSALELHTDEIKAALKQAGYSGPDLDLIGKYYEGYGAVYTLYKNTLDMDKAHAKTNKWVSEQRKKHCT